MKKFLLSLVALCCCMAIHAEEVTFDFVSETYDLGERGGDAYVENNAVATNGAVTIELSRTVGNGFRLWSDGLRVYNTKDGVAQISISAANSVVTGISVKVKATVTSMSVGTEAMSLDKTVYSWEGREENPNLLITTSSTKAIESMTVTYVSNDAPAKDAAEVSFSETEVTVKYGDKFTAPVLTKETTAPAVFSSSNEDVATVDEETGDVNILAPGTTVITATTAETEDYYAGRASYTLNVVKTVKSIAEAMQITDKNLQFIVDFPLTVAFKNYNNTFATDGTDFIQVYGSGQPDYVAGDVIPAGWIASYSFYNNVTPELMYKSGLQAATEHVDFVPAAVNELTVEDVNKVVTLKNVVFTEATPSTKDNFTGTVNGTDYTFRNNYTIEGVEAGTYDVTVVVNVYNSALQLYVVAYSEADAPTKKNAGVSFGVSSVSVKFGDTFTAPNLSKRTTAPAVYSSSNEEVATVDEETGAVTILAPGTTEIIATTAENAEFYAGRASYTLNVVQGVKSIAEAMQITDTSLEFIVDFPLTVAFKNGNNTFATDGADFIQVYGKGQPNYVAGDVIPAGWMATYSFYNGNTPELMYKSGLEAATEKSEFIPEVVTEVTVEDVNKVLTINGVVFEEDTPSAKENFTGAVNGTEYSFRNNYSIAGVAAGAYNVTFVVTIYNGEPSLYVIGYTVASGIEGIEAADAAADVEFFNMQGVRVANPENGLFIRRQGDKVEKVVIR